MCVNNYEATCILSPDLEADAVTSLVERFSGQISQGGGEVVKIDQWGKRKLAFEVKGKKEGVYVLFFFKSSREVAQDLERQFRLADEVIRHLVIRGN